MKKLKTAELQRKNLTEYKLATKIPVSVLLNDVRSLSNVGSIFRTCDAFMVEKLLLCGITGKPPHREIQKTALGATDSVVWEYHEDAVLLCESLKKDGYTIVGIEQTDNPVFLPQHEVDVHAKYLLILGNEVDGIQDELIQRLDYAIEIPQHGTKHSLNVSVAAGIVLYKFFESYI